MRTSAPVPRTGRGAAAADGTPSRSRRPDGGAAGARTFDRIRAVVRRIPTGRVASYGQVAALAGLPRHARLVGYALHAAQPDALPWHRVVNAVGDLSLARLDAAGGATQRLRLAREGVTFDARGRVRLARHRWAPRIASAAEREVSDALAPPRRSSRGRASTPRGPRARSARA